MENTSVIIGIGGQTSIGLSIPSINAAVRGDINCFFRSGYLLSAVNGGRLIVAALDTLPKHLSLATRMKTMALEAANQALAPVSADSSHLPSGLPVVLSVPPPRPGFDGDSDINLTREIMESLPVGIDKKRCVMINTGHAGGIAALTYATKLVRDEKTPVCLVGGVESYIDIDTLHWLEALGRLKGEEFSNGFIPGEGAAFLLVCSREYAARFEIPQLSGIVGASQTIEPKPWYSGEATIGKGLTDALHGVFDLPTFNGRKAEVTYCDLNGESWRVDEWMFAYTRTGKSHGEPLNIRHPADCWGDVGAASGALLAALATHEFTHGHGNNGTALVFCASDTRPFRAACLLERSGENKIGN
jgi:3-oxoacyl-[acyl-carrier-protein] synthase-1